MKPITNLNFLSEEMIICDKFNHYFIVLEKHIFAGERTCRLKLIDIDDNFCINEVTMPIACDENYDFISVNDKSFVYKFYETNITKSQIQSELHSILKKLQSNKPVKTEESKTSKKVVVKNQENLGTNN
jgi:hypothetical protein